MSEKSEKIATPMSTKQKIVLGIVSAVVGAAIMLFCQIMGITGESAEKLKDVAVSTVTGAEVSETDKEAAKATVTEAVKDKVAAAKEDKASAKK